MQGCSGDALGALKGRMKRAGACRFRRLLGVYVRAVRAYLTVIARHRTGLV